jgi:hypothetical protein
VVMQKNWLSYADATRGKSLLTHHIPSQMGTDCPAIEFRHRNVPQSVITVTTQCRRHCGVRNDWAKGAYSKHRPLLHVNGSHRCEINRTDRTEL